MNPDPLAPLVDLLAERVAQRVADLLAAPSPPARVYVTDAVAAGAPSAKWLRAQATHGRIVLHGARGRQFVFADELAALLEGTKGRRSTQRKATPAPPPNLKADASAAVAELRRQERA